MPEVMNMGIMIKFMSPLTVSVFWAGLAMAMAMAANEARPPRATAKSTK